MSTFTDKVYKIVKNIARGRTMTYKEVARLVGRPRAYRAVGNILSKNYNHQIPCHRVVRSDGKSGEYNRGANKKISLLTKEGASVVK